MYNIVIQLALIVFLEKHIWTYYTLIKDNNLMEHFYTTN